MSAAWMTDAACAGLPTEWFFPEDWGRGGDRKAQATRIAQVKEVCAGCPVQQRCLAEAPEFGIHGGLTADERARRAA